MAKIKRPLPPLELREAAPRGGFFVPAPELEKWIRKNFIEEDGPLFREEHRHLQTAFIGCLWTNVTLRQKQRGVAATAEMPSPQGNKWAQERAKQQMRQWFGIVPDFVLTFYAPENAEREDDAFCALVRHELLHCGQELDEFECPKFKKDGSPRFAIVGHEVEEFPAVIEDFGVYCGAGRSVAFVEAAKKAPRISEVKLAAACGTCAR